MVLVLRCHRDPTLTPVPFHATAEGRLACSFSVCPPRCGLRCPLLWADLEALLGEPHVFIHEPVEGAGLFSAVPAETHMEMYRSPPVRSQDGHLT